MRWKDEDLLAFEGRAKNWREKGTVTTHRIAGGRSKYGNTKTIVDGITFHSKKESERYSVLVLLEKAGEISDLQHQVRFDLKVKQHTVCAYVADFTYKNKYGQPIVEDSKGVRTPVYALKKKLMYALLGIEILET